jgi:hypothetical protein
MIGLNISEGDLTEKKLIPKPLRGSKSPLFWRFIEFLIRPENIAIEGYKNCIFLEKCT